MIEVKKFYNKNKKLFEVLYNNLNEEDFQKLGEAMTLYFKTKGYHKYLTEASLAAMVYCNGFGVFVSEEEKLPLDIIIDKLANINESKLEELMTKVFQNMQDGF